MGEGLAGKPVITLAELVEHSSGDALWLAIDDYVYDITEWRHTHPGGPVVLQNCAGSDASEAFRAYHPAWARRYLERLCVGRLAARQAVTPLAAAHAQLLADLQAEGLFTVNLWDYTRVAVGVTTLLAGAVVCVLQQRAVLGAVLLAAFWQQVAFVGHDCGHSAVFQSRRCNQLLGLGVTAACGISYSWWVDTHNVHHIHPNAAEHDPDIQFMPLLAISPVFFKSITSRYHNAVLLFDRFARQLISWQHITFFPLLMVAKYGLYGQALQQLSSGRAYLHRPSEAAAQLLFFLWVGCLTGCLHSWAARVAFIIVAHAAFAVLHLQICLSHFSRDVYKLESGEQDWLTRQVLSTQNWSCPAWLDFFHDEEHHMCNSSCS
ncbi:hypothetical protein WJX72_008896 [[Myrmecia] bisecta]|uniref:Cytochrome b5 heme-binding domain-containing protein n=1 Tax=[Myrmecia] bisecta TaxID=41462 RepID=A0AAW1P8Y4_9CHLO